MSHKNEKTQHFEKAEDIRTKVLDSMIYRLDERANMVITESPIPEWRAYTQWILIAALLVIFCILRYGVETVELHPTAKKDQDPVIEYRDRELNKTSEAFRARRRT
ncbi:Nitrogen regulatory IIA protein [Caenorhabditis elegans]|uniref:Nitrogen regulatory IIA protein n=1 Tax=Caenorhabditis elegans TaxID=6239 RepID=Q9GUF4_CAEEL|nr:Nitrogen regulatory IIA protein [Caenorhabditis elegans]CCD74169.1 Nitrogen regulatory IIA protein [Caenorhabditis elegans]|eukprot:NP_500979.1 Uncharacterized protein CELE_Y73B6BL.22 [Caenorhabditis elegans]